MKTNRNSLVRVLAVLLAGAAFTSLPLTARDEPKKTAAPATAAAGTLVPADAKTDAAWLAKAGAAYPLDSCVVSDDKFDGGAMGKPRNYLYQVSGQPDRLVRLCCKDCVKDFAKDPAQYLKKLDAAVATKAVGTKK